jgi:hypothetical protein
MNATLRQMTIAWQETTAPSWTTGSSHRAIT